MAQQYNPFNVRQVAQNMAQAGNAQIQQKAEPSEFEKQMLALQMSDKVGANTQLGFLIGQILGGGIKDWKQRYDARGAQKDKILSPNTTPDERAKLMEQIRLDDLKKYEKLVRQLAERGINYGGVPAQTSAQNPTQPDLSGINQDLTAQLTRQAAPPALTASPAELLSGGDNGSSLSRAVEAERAATNPTVNSPFQSYDSSGFDQYNLDTQEKFLEAALGQKYLDYANRMQNSHGWGWGNGGF